MNRWWIASARASGLRERLLRWIAPRRMRFVPYAWPLAPAECRCDVDLGEYLVERGIRGRALFHFGSGGHHWVGQVNHESGLGNQIMALTLSPREHASYVKRVIRNPEFGRHYKVLFADLYTLDAASLPAFDIITLFHLCEFPPAAKAGADPEDALVLQRMQARLAPGGLMMFYRRSFAFEQVRLLLEPAVAAGLLHFVEDYKDLAIYRAGAA